MKKKFTKRISAMFSMMLVFTMLFCGSSVFAKDSIKNYNPIVIIKDAAKDIPSNVVEDIVKSNEDAKVITIINWDGVSKSSMTTRGYNYYDIKKTTTSTSVASTDVFVTSVAKGQTKSITEAWSSTLEANATGDLSVGKLGLKGSITKKYVKNTSFVGPPQSSNYNSREFRVKFYESQGTWSARRVGTNGCNQETVTGTWSQPEKYAEYSIDKYIS